MCVAIIKPMGKNIPSNEILERCFNKNQDGAGLAYQNANKTGFKIVKGLMTYEAFKAALDKAVADMGGEEGAQSKLVLMHFRIGTHGSKRDPKHTHPFPLSGSIQKLEALKTTSAQVCMHNGILSGWGTSTYGVATPDKPALSDTMDFIKNFVYPLEHEIMAKEDSIWKNKRAQTFVTREVRGSRFVIANAKGGFLYWGQWHDHEGCMYSNKDYEAYKPAPYTYSYQRDFYRADEFDDDYWVQGAWKTSASSTPSLPPAAPLPPLTPIDSYDAHDTIDILDLVPGVKITQRIVDDVAEDIGFLKVGEKYGVRVFFKAKKEGAGTYQFIPSADKDVYLDPVSMEVWAFSWSTKEYRYVKEAAHYMLRSKKDENVWHNYAEV